MSKVDCFMLRDNECVHGGCDRINDKLEEQDCTADDVINIVSWDLGVIAVFFRQKEE